MDVKDVSVFKDPKSVRAKEVTDAIGEIAIKEAAPRARYATDVLYLDKTGGSIQITEENKWHDFTTALYSGKILTGILAGVESEGDKAYGIVMCDNFAVYIPVEDLGLLNGTTSQKEDSVERLVKLANTILMAEMDFMVTKVDKEREKVYGSRLAAMKKRCERFYFGQDRLIQKGKIVEARVIAVSEQSVRVEIRGAVVRMSKKDLSRAYFADCRELVAPGQRILVLVKEVRGSSFDNISVTVSARDAEPDNTAKEFEKVKIGGRYIGTVTAVKTGVYYIRLAVGVNVVCHKCNTRQLPTVKDKVAVVINYKDEADGAARGLIVQLYDGI